MAGSFPLWFAVASGFAASPQIARVGDIVALFNEELRFEFDLSKGTYRILSDGGRHPAISDARMKINDWASDDPAYKRTHEARLADGPFGAELALDLRFTAANRSSMVAASTRCSWNTNGMGLR